MKTVLTFALIIAVAGLVWSGDETKPNEPVKPLINFSPGTAKIVGEPMVKDFPAMKVAVAMEKASSYAPDGGYTMDESGVSKAYKAILDGGFSKLMNWAHQVGSFPRGPAFAMYFEDPSMTEPGKLTAKVGFPVNPDVKGTADVAIEDLPAMSAVALSFQGGYSQSGNAWTAAMDWAVKNGYEIAGPPMEVYLKGPMDVRDPNEFLTEIRIPVKKAEPKPVPGEMPSK